jgi:ferric-dicitrate binding protein FerR (iron transport regulator)
VRYSRRERLLDVRRGQALIKVAPDNRRFRVAAGFAEATTDSAQFAVNRRSSVTTVTVGEGEVSVFAGQPSWLDANNGVPPAVQRVKAGYQTRVDTAGLTSEPFPVTDAKSLVLGIDPTSPGEDPMRFKRDADRLLPKGR